MKFFILSLFVGILFVGCGKEPKPEVVVEVKEVLPKIALSMGIIHKHSLSSLDICSLQLYISHDIVLQRKIPASSSRIDNGVLVVNKEDVVHTIVIKKGTPCIAIKAENNRIVVKFDETLELTFMYTRGKKDLFLLTANKWSDSKGKLEINNEEYEAIQTSGQAYLMLNKIDKDDSNNHQRLIKGSLI